MGLKCQKINIVPSISDVFELTYQILQFSKLLCKI